MSATAVSPISDTYEDVEKLIWHTCHRFARRYGGDVEEMVGETHIVYMKAYESWRPNSGTKFSGYLTVCIWRRLIGFRNHRLRRKPIQAVSLDAPQPNGRTMAMQVADHRRPTTNVIRDLINDLSEDAAAVVQLVVDAPCDVAAIAEGKGGTPRNWSSTVRHHLRRLGWTPNRITETFEEIAGALT